MVPPECSHDLSCTCCLDDSLIFVHTEDNAPLSFMFLSFPRCLFILTNGLCSQSIMNYLVFSFAAAQKLLPEMKVPAVIALNSTLLLSWSSAASPDGLSWTYWKNCRLVQSCHPYWCWKFIVAPFYIVGLNLQQLLCLDCSECENEPDVTTLRACSGGQIKITPKCTMMKLMFRCERMALWRQHVVSAWVTPWNLISNTVGFSLRMEGWMCMGSPLLWVFPSTCFFVCNFGTATLCFFWEI